MKKATTNTTAASSIIVWGLTDIMNLRKLTSDKHVIAKAIL